VQVKNTAYMDEELEDKIRALRDRGYIIALKNYLGEERLRPYLYLFDVIRVNFSRTNSVFQRDAIRKRILPNTLFMADRVEREADFEFARELGYELFQGYLLGRPTLLFKEIPPLIETSYGQLLRILLRISPEIRWETECAQIIKNDLMLSYLFPREANALPPSSVPYAKNSKKSRPADMASIIYRMGPHVLRHWVCLALMREFNFSNNPELPRRAYVRGLFMEALASKSELYVDVRNGGAFLCGTFSLLEKIMGAPVRYLLREIGIPVGVWDALLGAVENDYAALLRYVTRYEARDPDLTAEESQTPLDDGEISRLYQTCWNDAEAAITNMDTPA
jgi:EAL and modified HD-GYP domain-containing signal transduction protein